MRITFLHIFASFSFFLFFIYIFSKFLFFLIYFFVCILFLYRYLSNCVQHLSVQFIFFFFFLSLWYFRLSFSFHFHLFFSNCVQSFTERVVHSSKIFYAVRKICKSISLFSDLYFLLHLLFYTAMAVWFVVCDILNCCLRMLCTVQFRKK